MLHYQRVEVNFHYVLKQIMRMERFQFQDIMKNQKQEQYYDWDALIEKIQKHGIRNVLTTTVAPTGTLSMLADCSNGMEPNFALVFEKRVTVGRFLLHQ